MLSDNALQNILNFSLSPLSGECGELARSKNIPLKKKPDGGGEADYDLEGILTHHITPGPMYRYKDDTCTDVVPVKDAKTIGCGAYHSMVVCLGDQGGGGGTVLAAGLNNYAQLGLGVGSSSDKSGDTESRTYLTRVQALEGLGVVSVKGGVHHSLVLTSQGEIFSFGRGDSGQLGVPLKGGEGGLDKAGSFSATIVSPILQGASDSSSGNGGNTGTGTGSGTEVVAIACGGNHNLAITASNHVYTWGYGDMLALGHGVERDEPLPKRINFSKANIGGSINVTQVAGGGQHSAIIGRVLAI
jgi:regulator of chromosome condensation